MPKSNHQPLHIVFLHLDLGIGGAEQLIVNLALASLPRGEENDNQDDNDDDYLNAKVSIFTTHCDQSHCFDAVRKSKNHCGRLANSVYVVGSFIPVNIFGYGTVFFSTIRMLYLSMIARWTFPNADVFLLDVLPTPIPFLIWSQVKSVIYYCHFPDKLLKRDTVNGVVFDKEKRPKQLFKDVLKGWYRYMMNSIEEWSMSYADLCCLNSNFTKAEVLKAFPRLLNHYTRKNGENPPEDSFMEVLYPAIDLDKFIQPDFESKKKLVLKEKKAPIVSLNRFERKKNIEVLLDAYSILFKKCNNSNSDISNSNQIDCCLPILIISGGYDPRNQENVEYLLELKHKAKALNIENLVSFRPNITDDERAELLQSAICVVYTPHREHFGIVPLEAMYAGSAVVAGNSGGPTETVINGKTGILVDMTPGYSDSAHNLAFALDKLLQGPKKAIMMGEAGHNHVKLKFGLKQFRAQWKELVLMKGIPNGIERSKTQRFAHQQIMIFIGFLVLILGKFLIQAL